MIELGGKIDENDVWFVTERYGAIDLALPCPKKGKQILPHISKFLLKSGKVLRVYHIKPVYYEDIHGKWRPLSEVTLHHGNRSIILNDQWQNIHPRFLRWLIKRQNILNGELLIPSPYRFKDSPVALTERNIFFTTTGPVYPDPGDPGTNTVDGHIYDIVASESWETKRNKSSGQGLDTTYGANQYATNSYKSGSNYGMRRAFFGFYTAGIPDGENIDSATISLYVNAATSADSVSACLVRSTQASSTTITVDDWDQTGGTSPSEGAPRWAHSSFSSAGYYTVFTLNATGLGWISKTGASLFAVRCSRDIDNSAPTGTNSLQIYYADASGTSTDPKMTVISSPSVSGAYPSFLTLDVGV